MARIRSVHPSLFTDEAWVSCSPLARILYIGLWTDADDQGLFEWKPLQIKMRLLPGDGADCPTLLDELSDVGLIASFEVSGRKYGAIRNFRTFQRPKKPNALFPLPPEWEAFVGLSASNSEPVPNRFRTSGEKAPQMEDGGEDVVDTPQPPLPGGVSDEEFAAIWEAYPASGRETCPAAKARAEVDAAAAGGHSVADMLDGAKRASAHVAGGGRAKRIDRWARERLFAKPDPPRALAKTWDGPADLWAAVANAKGAGWTTSYLGSCRWTGNGLRTASPTVRKALEAEVGAILRDHGAKIEMQQVSA